jgi:tyrosyl-tRNA synthetase
VDGGRNPKEVKVLLAKEIVARFHSAASAKKAEEAFEARHRDGALPEDMPEKQVGETQILKVLKEAGLVPSTNEASRVLEQGGVRVNGEKVEDRNLQLKRGDTVVIQVGKRKFARVTVR